MTILQKAAEYFASRLEADMWDSAGDLPKSKAAAQAEKPEAYQPGQFYTVFMLYVNRHFGCCGAIKSRAAAGWCAGLQC